MRSVTRMLAVLHTKKSSETVQGVISDLYAFLVSVQPPVVPSPVEPTINYVDRRFIQGSSQYQNERSRRNAKQGDKTRYICKNPGCRSWKHSTKERLRAFRGNCVLKQFLLTLDNDSGEDENNLADVIEEIIVNLTESSGGINSSDDVDGQIHSRLATITNENATASFVSTLKENIVSHVVSAVIPNRPKGEFEDVLIDTCAVRGSIPEKNQYLVYCISIE